MKLAATRAFFFVECDLPIHFIPSLRSQSISLCWAPASTSEREPRWTQSSTATPAPCFAPAGDDGRRRLSHPVVRLYRATNLPRRHHVVSHVGFETGRSFLRNAAATVVVMALCRGYSTSNPKRTRVFEHRCCVVRPDRPRSIALLAFSLLLFVHQHPRVG